MTEQQDLDYSGHPKGYLRAGQITLGVTGIMKENNDGEKQLVESEDNVNIMDEDRQP